MANTNSNRKLVPEAMDSLDRFKYEVASDVCVKNLFIIFISHLSYFIFIHIFLLIIIVNLLFYFLY